LTCAELVWIARLTEVMSGMGFFRFLRGVFSLLYEPNRPAECSRSFRCPLPHQQTSAAVARSSRVLHGVARHHHPQYSRANDLGGAARWSPQYEGRAG